MGISSLTDNAKEIILKSKNMLPVTTLKGMYSYIEKVDYIITRGGFNSITECLFFKKPTIFMNEKYNPEVDENLKIVFEKKLGALMNTNDWKANFIKRVNNFVTKEEGSIRENLKKNHFKSNGAKQLLKIILKDIKK